MRIFVTGGTGFIGKYVVRLLARKGYSLLVLTRKPPSNWPQLTESVAYLQGNLQTPSTFAAAMVDFKPKILIHLAWEGLPDYSLKMCKKNFDYSIDIYSLAMEAGCSCVITAGSCWEYSERIGKLSEDSSLETFNLFSAVKNAIRFFGEAIAGNNNCLFYWLRIFFTYGPGQRSTSLVPHIIESIKHNRSLQINSPENKIDFIFVEDVAQAILKIIENEPQNSIYNVGTGNAICVKEVVKIIHEIMNKVFNEKMFINRNISNPIQDFRADITQIQKDIGWHHRYDIRSGIEKTINNFVYQK